MSFVASPPRWSDHSRIAEVVDLGRPRKVLTIIYVLRRRATSGSCDSAATDKFEVLLGHKARGFGEGRWNGFGGKFDPTVDASVAASAARELLEEANIAIDDVDVDASAVPVAASASYPQPGVHRGLSYDGLMFYQYESHLQEKLFDVHVFSCRLDGQCSATTTATLPVDVADAAAVPQPTAPAPTQSEILGIMGADADARHHQTKKEVRIQEPASSEEMNPISWFTIPPLAAEEVEDDGIPYPKTPLVGANQPALPATRPIPLRQMWPDDKYWLLPYLHRRCAVYDAQEKVAAAPGPQASASDESMKNPTTPGFFVGAFAFKGYDAIVESHVEFAAPMQLRQSACA